jgi:probable phosphoglycerate mutase
LVRHGNTFEAGETPVQVGARTDLCLTAQGRRQAEEVGKYLIAQALRPAAIYAGTLKRQIESAQLIARAVKSPLNLHETALTEIDYGAWEGLTAEEIERRWPEEYAQWTKAGEWPEKIFNGSRQNHKLQLELWLQRLRNTYAPGDVIIAVSSNGLIRFFSDATIPDPKVKTGHFCELDISPTSFQIKSWNSSPSKF